MRGMLRYESLVDGTVGIMDVALLNDAISVQDENARRYRERVNRHG